MASQTEESAMVRAIKLAALGLGGTSPNPPVGCVVLDRAGAVVGEGFHEYPGGPHAEVAALRQAGPAAHGGTAVVTLEPCNHTGRTGPCTQALLAAGVTRVVVAVRDHNPAATGGGVEMLRAAGVDVETGVLTDQARAGNISWLTAVGRGRPYLIWKFAATLDGRAAAADGSSQWITSPQARADVHELRATCDAIIAGVGTVLADDPALTVRGPAIRRPPLRVVVDTAGRTPAGAQVRDDAAPTWIVTGAEVGTADGRVDLPKLLTLLYERGIRRALLEGGPTLAGAMLAAGLVDEVVGYLAPKLLGAGPSVLGAAGVTTISESIGLDITEVVRIGPDLRLRAGLKEA